MHDRSQHDQEMEYIVRAAPDVETARFDGFRTSRGVEEGTEGKDGTFEEIVWQSRCHPHAMKAVDDKAVSDRYKAG